MSDPAAAGRVSLRVPVRVLSNAKGAAVVEKIPTQAFDWYLERAQHVTDYYEGCVGAAIFWNAHADVFTANVSMWGDQLQALELEAKWTEFAPPVYIPANQILTFAVFNKVVNVAGVNVVLILEGVAA